MRERLREDERPGGIPEGSPARVLLCDDTPEMRLLLRIEFGCHPELQVVGEAADGRQAIEKADELQPDVVLLDLAMPAMDGLEALPHIMKAAPGTRVIVLSGFDAETAAHQALALGACCYIEKGTEPSGIAEQVVRAARVVDLTEESIVGVSPVYLEGKQPASSGQGEIPDRR